MPPTIGNWLTSTAAPSWDDVLRLRPNLIRPVTEFIESVWHGDAHPVVLELCRLRIARLLDAPAELAIRRPEAIAAGLTEEKVAALGCYLSDDRFSAVERACITMAEHFVLDPHGLTDADIAEVSAFLTPPELVSCVFGFAVFDSICRAERALGVTAIH